MHGPINIRSILILFFHVRLGQPSGLFPAGLPTISLCVTLRYVTLRYVYRNKFHPSFVSDIKVDDPETEKAATKIQAVYRGHRTRQNMKSGDVKEAEQDLNAEFNPNDEGNTRYYQYKPNCNSIVMVRSH